MSLALERVQPAKGRHAFPLVVRLETEWLASWQPSNVRQFHETESGWTLVFHMYVHNWLVGSVTRPYRPVRGRTQSGGQVDMSANGCIDQEVGLNERS